MSAPAQITLGLVDREKLGRAALDARNESWREQGVVSSEITGWEKETKFHQEVFCRIGETLFRLGRASVLAPVKAKRICAECGLQIGKRHKWHIGPDSRIRHRDCTNPIKPNPLAA